MKYGLARFVWGLTGVVLNTVGIGMFGMFFNPPSEHAAIPKTASEIFVATSIAAIPLVLGVLCLLRCKYWSREARKKA